MKDRKKSIHSRHHSIEQRKHYGHWEGDLILFDRLIVAIKNASRQAKTTTDFLVSYSNQHAINTIKSLTLDNGVEFTYHEKMSRKLKSIIFYYDPYKTYQKGAIKNANKLLQT